MGPQKHGNGYKLVGFTGGEAGDRRARYRFLWRWVVIVTSLVALTPLFILTFMNYFQYERALKAEIKERVDHMTSSTMRSMEFFLSERRAALSFVAREKTPEELGDQKKLADIFHNLQAVLGDMVDLGLIGPQGRQISYVGPYELIGKDYSTQDWFHEVMVRGFYVSDVFLGYRKFPHFVIAVVKKGPDGKNYVLRATVDSEILARQLRSLNLEPPSEAFIINRRGILQTPSVSHGALLEKVDLPVPAIDKDWEVVETATEDNDDVIMGYASVSQSPFVLMVIKDLRSTGTDWFSLRRNVWLVLFISSIIILFIITMVAYYMVSRIREADSERAKVLHKAEYQNKMASLGRLAAGVAHEINNPLAIMNEKAGMIKDIIAMEADFPRKDKMQSLTDSILQSVDRCSRVTRRLLGFAKHIDVEIEEIDMEKLIEEVIGFLEHEARYKNVHIGIQAPEDADLTIKSDRGQLEQVFLNLLNNAMNALSEQDADGKIKITLSRDNSKGVSVTVADNGPGIRRENLRHIFEPFYTTRKEGTGLGLSITYGIVDKLGGQIEVESEVGKGTSFTVTMPVQGA